MDSKYYDNDDVMAALGRGMIDGYISWCNKHGRPQDLTGWESYAQGMIESYIEDEWHTSKQGEPLDFNYSA